MYGLIILIGLVFGIALGKELNIELNQKHSHFILPNLKKHYLKVNYEADGIIYGIVKTPEQYN